MCRVQEKPRVISRFEFIAIFWSTNAEAQAIRGRLTGGVENRAQQDVNAVLNEQARDQTPLCLSHTTQWALDNSTSTSVCVQIKTYMHPLSPTSKDASVRWIWGSRSIVVATGPRESRRISIFTLSFHRLPTFITRLWGMCSRSGSDCAATLLLGPEVTGTKVSFCSCCDVGRGR